MEFVQSGALPEPAGHYSQAVVAGGLVFLSGILPLRAQVDPAAGFEAQCASVFDQAGHVLRAAGCAPDDIAQCTAYIVGIEHWPAFNGLYAAWLGSHKPARTVVPVPALHHGYLIELQLVALRPQASF